MGMSHISGVVVSPLSGLMARELWFFSPWVFMVVAVTLALLCTMFFFQEAEIVNVAEGMNLKLSCQSVNEHIDTQAPSPFQDRALIMLATATFLYVIQQASLGLLLPLQLVRFGYADPFKYPDLQEREKRLASIIGVLLMPYGLGVFLSATIVYVPVTKWLGDAVASFVIGIVMFAAWVCCAFADSFWQLFISLLFAGFCGGFMTPAMAPLTARYAAMRHPSKMATAQGMSQFGVFLSLTLAQNIDVGVLAIFDSDALGLRMAWLLNGATGFTACLLVGSFAILTARLESKHKEAMAANNISMLPPITSSKH